MSVYRVCLQTGVLLACLYPPAPPLSSLTPGHKASPHVLIVEEQPAKTAISRQQADGPIQQAHTIPILHLDYTDLGRNH